MAFNINDFRQNLQFGGARPNLFEVEVAFPGFVPGGTGAANKFAFTCKAASVPGMTAGVVEVPYFNRIVKLAGDKSFDEWSITVINDEDFVVRDAFEQWHNAINQNDGDTSQTRSPEALGVNSYVANMTLKHYGKAGNVIKQYQLVNAHPSQVEAMELSWDNRDQVEEFGVTIVYDYFITDSAAGGIGSGSFASSAQVP